MDNNGFQEHPLDSLLDEESDESFGALEVESTAQQDEPAILKNWSAQDFSDIYVRFKPHLERHARRYLSNPVQAEEVVQDAFLYLMTTLPEIDNEVGVLKFLKWKIRLLSFDILRSASFQREHSVLPENLDGPSEDGEISLDLERAEDNAVIRLALAKLNPRHREALLASVYEEKSAQEVGEQLEMSPNAARQLVFRARRAFRLALIGEAESRDKSVSEILSMAAKKAAADVKANAVRAGVLVALLAGGIALLPTLEPETNSTTASTVIQAPDVSVNVPRASSNADEESNQVLEETNSAEVESETEVQVEIVQVEELDTASSTNPLPQELATAGADVGQAEPIFLRDTQVFDTIMSTDVQDAGLYTGSYAALFEEVFTGESIEVFGGTGISAFLDFNSQEQVINQVVFQMRIDGQIYFGIAQSTTKEKIKTGNGSTLVVIAQDFYVVDEDRNIYPESALSGSVATVEVTLASEGNPESASLKIQQD